MEMNPLDSIMFDILEILEDIYFDLNLILLAIKMDDIAALVEPEPLFFNPLKTIGKYK